MRGVLKKILSHAGAKKKTKKAEGFPIFALLSAVFK